MNPVSLFGGRGKLFYRCKEISAGGLLRRPLWFRLGCLLIFEMGGIGCFVVMPGLPKFLFVNGADKSPLAE